MNRRIQKKRAKQLAHDATTRLAHAEMLRRNARALRSTGPITEGLRQRALFRARRHEAEAIAMRQQAAALG